MYHISLEADKIQEGAEKAIALVGSTFGPYGGVVAIDQIDQSRGPKVTKDGVTVARAIALHDRLLDMGAQIVKDACSRTNYEAGDGTTSTAVLLGDLLVSSHFVKNYLKTNNETRAQHQILPMVLRRINDLMLDYVNSASHWDPKNQTMDSATLYDVAMVSSNGNKQLSERVVQAFIAADGGNIDVSYQEGLSQIDLTEIPGATFPCRLDSGFWTNHSLKQTTYGESVVIALQNKLSLNSFNTAAKELLALAHHNGNGPDHRLNGVILCAGGYVDAAAKQAISLMSDPLCPINIMLLSVNHLPEQITYILRDLQALSGCGIITDFSETTDSGLGWGQISGITSGYYNTVISRYSTDLQKSMAETRIEELRAALDHETDAFKKDFLKKCIGRVAGQTVKLTIGAPTKVQTDTLRDQAEDVLHSVRAATLSGVSAGAFETYLNAAVYASEQLVHPKTKVDICAAVMVKELVGLLSRRRSDLDSYYKMYSIEQHGEFKVLDPTSTIKAVIRNAFSGAETVLSCRSSLTLDRDLFLQIVSSHARSTLVG